MSSALLAAIAALPRRPPLLVKIAPDQAPGALPDIVAVCIEGGADGMIVSNTTVARPDSLRGTARHETGGLSGAPLRDASTAILRDAARRAAGRLVLVGCGGVATGADALQYLMAGAAAVAIGTSALRDPRQPERIVRELGAWCEREGVRSLSEVTGTLQWPT